MSFRPGCSCCEHPNREAIDTAVVGGVALRDIAKTYSLTKSAVHRHRLHVSTSIVKAAARAEVKYENTLLGDAQDLRTRTLRLLDVAEETKDTRLQAVMLGQVRANIELLSKLTAPPPTSEADAQKVLFYFAEEAGVTPDELRERCEEHERIAAEIKAGRTPPHRERTEPFVALPPAPPAYVAPPLIASVVIPGVPPPLPASTTDAAEVPAGLVLGHRPWHVVI